MCASCQVCVSVFVTNASSCKCSHRVDLRGIASARPFCDPNPAPGPPADGWSCHSPALCLSLSRSRTGGHPIWLLSYSLWHAGSDDSGIPLHCESTGLSRKLQLECVLAITGRIFRALFVTLFFLLVLAPHWHPPTHPAFYILFLCVVFRMCAL